LGTDSEIKKDFYKTCISNGLEISLEQLDLLERYKNLLLDWNGKINLVSRKDEKNIWTSHILHCLSPLFRLNIVKGARIADIGTGGGMPGIPIKIVRPDLYVLCVDSTAKKIKAVAAMIHDLGLKEIETVWGRAEDLGTRSEYLHKFDFITARAVAPLADLLLWTADFLKKRSTTVGEKSLEGSVDPGPPAFLVYKGGDISGEIEEAKKGHTGLKIFSIELAFEGADIFFNDKKLLIIHL
jgi:16S rRNA (guanine527-N7)-methyltransferase